MNINISGEVVRTSQLPKRIIGLGDYLVALNSSPLETSTVLVSDFVSFLNTQFATSLASLTDVSINGPLPGQALVFNGSYWVNQGIGELDTLDSVTTRGNTTLNSITTGGLYSPYLRLDTVATPTLQAGMFAWNDVDGTANLRLKGNNVTLQIGQETVARVVNKTGADLLESEYKVVRVRVASEGGAQGQRLAVVLAQGDNDPDSATTLGVVTENIGNNQEGFITILGNVNGINTTGSLQGENWVDGDVLYLSPTTPGALTKVKPQAPQHTLIVGYVVYAHQNNGKIFVKVDNGYELDELHNVLITSPANNDLLQYDSTQQVWKNVAPSIAVPTPTLAQVTTAGNTTTNSASISGFALGIVGAVGNTNYITKDIATTIALANSSTAGGVSLWAGTNASPISRVMAMGNGDIWMLPTTGVFIGTTTNAGYKLDVNGTARVTGAVLGGTYNGVTIAGDNNITRIGLNAAVSGDGGVAIGRNASAHRNGVAIGFSTSTSGTNADSVAIGFTSVSNANEFVMGSGANNCTNIYFGSGKVRTTGGGGTTNGDGVSYTINGSGALGTDFAGGNLTLAGGKGTGTGTSGSIIFSTSIVTTTGTTLQTLTERMRIDGSGNVGIGTSSPTAKLHVYTGNGGGIPLLIDGSNSSDGTIAKFGRGIGGTEKNFYISSTNNQYINLGTEGDFKFKVGVTADQPYATGVSAMVITAVGNVLIGTTTDAGYKLHVNGTTYSNNYVGNSLQIYGQGQIFSGSAFQLFNTANNSKAGIQYINEYGLNIGINSENLSGVTRLVTIGGNTKASANNDVLVGLDIAPTFTNGAFTGVSNIGLRVQSGKTIFGSTTQGQPSEHYFESAGTNPILVVRGITPSSSDIQRWYNNNNLLAYLNASGDFYAGRLRVSSSGPSYPGISFSSDSSAGIGYTSGITVITNNTERLRVFNTTGNVGINTTTDAGYKLDVNGTARVVSLNGISFLTSNEGTTGNLIAATGRNITFVEQGQINTQNGSAFTFRAYADSMQSLVQNASGRTTNFIWVKSGFSGANYANTTGVILNINPTYSLTGTNSGTLIRGIYYNPVLTDLASATHRAIETTSGDVIFNGGNVGIGTTSPSEILSISGGNVSMENGRFIKFNYTTPFWIGADSTANGFTVFDATASLRRLSITTAGNVLINTTTDAGYKLDVNGTARFTGNVSLGSPNINDKLEVYGNILIRANDRIRLAGTSDGNTAIYAASAVNITANVRQNGSGTFDVTFGALGSQTRVFRVNDHTGHANVVIGVNAVSSATAVLQADSTTQGFLPPRMTSAQRTAITSPAAGLIVFDTDIQNLCFFRDGVWVQVSFAAI